MSLDSRTVAKEDDEAVIKVPFVYVRESAGKQMQQIPLDNHCLEISTRLKTNDLEEEAVDIPLCASSTNRINK